MHLHRFSEIMFRVVGRAIPRRVIARRAGSLKQKPEMTAEREEYFDALEEQQRTHNHTHTDDDNSNNHEHAYHDEEEMETAPIESAGEDVEEAKEEVMYDDEEELPQDYVELNRTLVTQTVHKAFLSDLYDDDDEENEEDDESIQAAQQRPFPPPPSPLTSPFPSEHEYSLVTQEKEESFAELRRHRKCLPVNDDVLKYLNLHHSINSNTDTYIIFGARKSPSPAEQQLATMDDNKNNSSKSTLSSSNSFSTLHGKGPEDDRINKIWMDPELADGTYRGGEEKEEVVRVRAIVLSPEMEEAIYGTVA